MQRLYMPRCAENEQNQRVKNLSPAEVVRETKLRFDAKLCEDGYAKRMTEKYARFKSISCFSKGLKKCSRLHSSLPPEDYAKFESDYCACESSCVTAATPTPSPKSPPTVASPLLLQNEDLPQNTDCSVNMCLNKRDNGSDCCELAYIVEGERRQTKEEKDAVVQRTAQIARQHRQRLIANTRQKRIRLQNNPPKNIENIQKKHIDEEYLEVDNKDQLMKDLDHQRDQMDSPHCTTPPAPLLLRRHVSCLKSNKKATNLRKRVSFSKDTKCHDGLGMDQHCLDLLVWNYFVRNTVSNFDHVTALVADATKTHLDTNSTAETALAIQSCLQKLTFMLVDLKRRVNTSSNGIAPVLPGGGGFGAKLEGRHLGDVDELYNMVSKAKDMALAASHGHTKRGCLNAINLQNDSLGSPRSRSNMMVTGVVAKSAGKCSPVGSSKHVNTPLSSC